MEVSKNLTQFLFVGCCKLNGMKTLSVLTFGHFRQRAVALHRYPADVTCYNLQCPLLLIGPPQTCRHMCVVTTQHTTTHHRAWKASFYSLT